MAGQSLTALLLLTYTWCGAGMDEEIMHNKVGFREFRATGLIFYLQYERQRYDGWYNNLAHPGWGTVDSHLVRKTPPSYADGVYMMSGGDRSVNVLECGVTTI